MRRKIAVLLLISVLTSLLGPCAVFANEQNNTSDSTEVNLNAVADTYVQDGGGKEVNYGTGDALLFRASNYRISYIKFDLNSVKPFFDVIDGVKLKVYAKANFNKTLYVAIADNDWNENEVTFLTKPDFDAENPIAATSEPLVKNTYAEIDVSDIIRHVDETGVVTLALYDPSGEQVNSSVASRESDNKPVLSFSMNYTPEITELEISGADSFNVPFSGEEQYHYTAKVLDQLGAPVEDAVCEWAFKSDYEGLSVSADGVVTVTENALPRIAILTASCSNAYAEYEIEIKENPYMDYQSKTVTLPVVGDTFVQGGGSSDKNNGSGLTLTVRSKNYKNVFVKFDTSKLTGVVRSATLKMYKMSGNEDEFVIGKVLEDWEELNLTYSNRPLGDSITELGEFEVPARNGVCVEVDVTDAFNAGEDFDDTVSFTVYDTDGAENNVSFYSREAEEGKYAPVLEVSVLYKPESVSAELSSGTEFIIPYSDTAQYELTPVFKDQYGEIYEPQNIIWTVENIDGEEYNGISINDEGVLTVESTAQMGSGCIVIVADGQTYDVVVDFLGAREAVDRAAEEFVLEGKDYVLEDIDLPLSGKYNTTIWWESESPEYITAQGKVTRPQMEDGDKTVILTAHFVYGDEEAVKTIEAFVVRESVTIALLPVGKTDENGNNMGANLLQGGSNADKCLPGQLMLRYDRYRMGIMKYDLGEIDVENIISARIEFDGGRSEIRASNVTRDDWDPATITYNEANAVPSLLGGEILADGYMNKNNKVEIDITEAVKKDYAQDNSRIFSLYIYSTLMSETNFSFGAMPRLYIEAIYTPEPSEVSIKPLNRNQYYMAKPLNGTMKTQYIGAVIDQNGAVMEREELEWSTDREYSAIDVLGNLGELPEWPFSDVVVPVGTIGKEIIDVKIEPEIEGDTLPIKAVSKSNPDIGCTFEIELRESTPNSRQHPYFTHTKEDLPQIRERVKSGAVADLYASDKLFSNEYKVNDLIPENVYRYKPWRNFNNNFTVPENAVYADFGIYLYGKGEVGLDSASLLSITSETIDINNESFETGLKTPAKWEYDYREGDGKISYETVASGVFHAWNGKRYMKLVNDSSDDVTGIVYKNTKLTPGAVYTFDIYGSQLMNVEKGTFIEIRFYDKDHNYLEDSDSVSQGFNRITFTKRNTMPGLPHANVWMIEENLEYAQKAKYSLLYFLYDTQWGMQYWINTGTNLDDTYQAVHIGRRLYDWALLYDRFVDSGVITPEEDNIIREKMYWIAETMLDTQYYNYLNLHEKRHNFNLDRSNGLLAFSLIFPEYQRSSKLLEHALYNILWQMKYSVGEDGSWPECIRYHSSIQTKIFSSASILKQIDYTNLLEDSEYDELFDDPANRTLEEKDILHNAKFKKTIDFLMRVQTARDAVNTRMINGAQYPAIGDTQWNEATAIMPYVIITYIDSEYPDEQEMVQHAKYVYNRQNGSDIADYFADLEKIKQVESKNLKLTSTKFDDGGYVIFRQNYGLDNEDYVIVQASSENYINSHQNNDRGTFSLFYRNTPMMLDPGVGNYTDGSGQWFSISSAHNIISYYDANANEVELSEKPGTIHDFESNNLLDYTKVQVVDHTSISEHIRNIAYLKGGFNILLVHDSVDVLNETLKESRLNFNIMGTDVALSGKDATATCYNNKMLDVKVLKPENTAINEVQRGIVSGSYPKTDGDTVARQAHLQASAKPGDDYFTLITPYDKTDHAKTVTKVLYDDENTVVYEIKKSDSENKAVVAINNSDSAKNVEFEYDNNLLDITTSDAYDEIQTNNDKISFNVPKDSMRVFMSADYVMPYPERIEIYGKVQQAVPSQHDAESKSYYEAVLYDCYGNAIDDANISYSVSGNGVSIDSQSGLLTVTGDAVSGQNIVVTASSGDIKSTMNVSLKNTMSVLTSIKTNVSDKLLIPEQGKSSYKLDVEIADQFGVAMTTQPQVWTVVDELPEGVSFDSSQKTLTITSSASEGSTVRLRVSAKNDISLFKMINIKLEKEEWHTDSIIITGSDTVKQGKTSVYTAIAYNQYGQSIENAQIVFSTDITDNVSIDNNGCLSVSEQVSEGTVINVSAQCNSKIATMSVTVLKASDNAPVNRPSYPASGGGGGGGGGSGKGITPIVPKEPSDISNQPSDDVFGDIDTVEWAKEAILGLYDMGIINGKSENIFAPDAKITREEFVKILNGVFNISPDNSAEFSFEDVDKYEWYYGAVSSACRYGIIKGFSETQFGIGANITREDMLVMMMRAVEAFDIKLNMEKKDIHFNDENTIADYAVAAVMEFAQRGIVNGYQDGSFAPKNHTTRAEAAVILYRIYNIINSQTALSEGVDN